MSPNPSDPAYETYMAHCSERLLAALWREHPRILRHLTKDKRNG